MSYVHAKRLRGLLAGILLLVCYVVLAVLALAAAPFALLIYWLDRKTCKDMLNYIANWQYQQF